MKKSDTRLMAVRDTDPDRIFVAHGLAPSASIDELWERLSATYMTQEQIYCFEYVRDHRPLYERYAIYFCFLMPHIAVVSTGVSKHLISESCTSCVRWPATLR
jgi:hypothetical protein